MNPISKIHQEFSRRLNNPRVLSNPEEFLGANYEAVLNFWLILDDLSEEQLRIVKERYRAFYDEKYYEWCKATDLVWDASVVGYDYTIDSSRAAHDATDSWVAAWATLELIGMHKILEDQQNPLTFFQMFLDQLP
jgi:hypothetical protein